jgi:membrane-associated phospholipid phosphatase
MTVFTAFFVAVWLHYPRCRPFVIASLTILGPALVLTNYHYPGDVIAGFFCGILITTVTSHLIAKTENAM